MTEPRIRRNLATPESRAWWESAERAAQEVATWPAHRRAMVWPYQDGEYQRGEVKERDSGN